MKHWWGCVFARQKFKTKPSNIKEISEFYQMCLSHFYGSPKIEIFKIGQLMWNIIFPLKGFTLKSYSYCRAHHLQNVDITHDNFYALSTMLFNFL